MYYKGKVKVRSLPQRHPDTWPEALYNLGSGRSRLTWANDTVAHYAAIHCLHQRTGPLT